MRAVCAGAGAYQPWLAWCILGCTCAYVFITLRVCFYNNACINSQQAPPLPWLACVFINVYSLSLSPRFHWVRARRVREKGREQGPARARTRERARDIYIHFWVSGVVFKWSQGALLGVLGCGLGCVKCRARVIRWGVLACQLVHCPSWTWSVSGQFSCMYMYMNIYTWFHQKFYDFQGFGVKSLSIRHSTRKKFSFLLVYSSSQSDYVWYHVMNFTFSSVICQNRTQNFLWGLNKTLK